MNLLLDTHIFLWFITWDPKLPAKFATAIRDPANKVHLGVASIWEVIIKHALGKLTLPDAPAEYLPRQRLAHGILSLPVDEGAMPHLANLPPLHRDPFDRILIAQTLQHGMRIVTVDPQVLNYPVPFLPQA